MKAKPYYDPVFIEPEITPEMVEAGVNAYWANTSSEPNRQELREVVREVYLAMVEASRK